MEYEIYYLCNILGLIIIFLVILFHFVDADGGTQNLLEDKPKNSVGQKEKNYENSAKGNKTNK